MPEEDIMLTFIFPGMLTILCGIFALRIRKVSLSIDIWMCQDLSKRKFDDRD